jgi:IclR family mhp operon transcriptional activator
MTEAPDGIRAVVRALDLIRRMNDRPLWSLQALHGATGLPKSTLSRLLGTLIAEGYVQAEAPAGTYRLTAQVEELAAGSLGRSRLVDIARPIALEVTRRIKWPLAVGLLERDAMVVRFSSMPYSPLAVHTTTLGHRLGLFESAMGRAYLAFCSEVERKVFLALLPERDPDDEGLTAAWIRQDLATVRAQGHAVRQPGAGRGTATLAVPILAGPTLAEPERVAGVLAMTTFGGAMTGATIAEHAPILRDTARAIAQALPPDSA